ncbi:acyl-CoA thioesterase II [Allonocardiopsis opalescens]|uniref:Acyl-CoA thioesterase 2 n=1 Tax=Allonocardiopsis opalescens TaxID=1144618 RepID=A0A2T0QDL9_9ACTN|nr:acyl-CoA thioesterase II [Allonocardiopsis opalescens]PRY02019.1 acyl-CoA thioesterase-2 [Allonocardiopsis opalescens]
MASGLADVLRILDLERIEVNIFRGSSPDDTVQRVFGGQVAGQALVAAGRTVPEDRRVHSLHAYFIRPGDPAVPIVYEVDRVRDGRSFTTRRVVAIQHGKPIFTLSASFHGSEPGLSHQSEMPEVAGPDELPPVEERLRAIFGELPQPNRRAFDMHPVGPLSWEVERDPGLRTTRNQVWLRTAEKLPDDPLLHVCLMTYASDVTLLDTTLLPHGRTFNGVQMASLDHAMWFHAPFRIDDWLLYAQETPFGGGGRGLARGEVFTAEGRLVCSVVQEGLIRPMRPSGDAERTG